ncbi:hypothetical protein V2G26_000363 [Clonostachys chloroleuca]
MHHSALLALGLVAGQAVAETVHGVVVFSRHGDRTSKHYSGYGLTSLGASQNFQVGSDYRARYLEAGSEHQILGISPDQYEPSQIFASAPTSGILSNTATAFLQGLYPPLADINQELSISKLNNGSDSTAPLEGYQYVLLTSIGAESPDTIWIKGGVGCPSYTNASKSFKDSADFKARSTATKDFYAGFYDALSPGVADLKPENMTYKNAYDIFDLANTARIHNSSSAARNISDADMFQLRTLADSAEFGANYNASQPARSIGAQTLAGGVLAQLNQTVATKGKLKFSLFAGSYDTFLSFFGITGLTSLSTDFEGLPDYASTMVFELFTDATTDKFPDNVADLKVRWMLRNGTAGALTAYPLFGQKEEALPYTQFRSEMDKRAISDVKTWCNTCSSQEQFCAAYRTSDDDATVQTNGGSKGGMSNAVAGVIGAMVTLGVVAIVGAIAFVLLRKRKAQAGAVASEDMEKKRSLDSGTPSA